MENNTAITQPITVEALYTFLGKAIKEGHGKKHVYLSSDDEGNDYHGCYYAPTTDPKEVDEYMKISCSGLSRCADPKNAVLL